YMDTNMMALEPEGISTEFLYLFISKTGLYKIADTSTIPQINNKHIEPYKIIMPEENEQQKIGNLFGKLDQAISLQQQVLETTKEYKQSMLQKMFPKKGEKVPKIRFKEFKDNWQYSKFKNIADIFRGLTYKPSDLTNEQGTRVLRSSNIEVDQFRIFSDDVFVEDNAADIIPIEKNNIIITSANGSKNLVGKHAVVNQNIGKAVVGGFMYSVRTDYPYFLNSWMNTDLYSDVLRLVQGGGGSIGNLPINALKQQNILMPSMNERKKIGSFFKTLDEKIEQEEKKL